MCPMIKNLKYKNRKQQLVGLIVLLIVFICMLSGCSNNTNDNKYELSSGLYVKGDRTDFYEALGVLYICSNDVIIGGEANQDVMITLKDIETVTFNGLEQGDYKIHVDTTEGTSSCNIKFTGNNTICSVLGYKKITLEGSKDTEVVITACVQAFEDLLIKDIVLTTSSLSSYKKILITGKTKLDIKETVHESYEGNDFYSRISAFDKIIIDLEKDGSLNVSDFYNHDPIYSESTIELGKNTEIIQPEDVYIFNITNESYFVDQNGNSISSIYLLGI